jgi:uncharacterized Zn finger protein (UPF0148 family)
MTWHCRSCGCQLYCVWLVLDGQAYCLTCGMTDPRYIALVKELEERAKAA